MDWYTIYTKEKSPTFEQVGNFINNPLWNSLNDHIQNSYKISPYMEYSSCSMQPGWNVKYKKSGKSLCTCYPMEGYFTVLVVIGNKEMSEANLAILFCSEYVQRIFQETKTGQGQKWLMIDVKTESTVEDIMSLIALRIKPININN